MIFAKLNRLYALLVLVAVAVIAAALVWMVRGMSKSTLTIGADGGIDDTPLRVESMRAIGQWEFMAIADEEMVDTVRKGIFSDDRLVRIYYGTLRIGVDMQKLSDNAFTPQGDSIIVCLPAVQLLDESFIDEARTKSFFESGRWAPADREDLMHRAARQMRERCLTYDNMRLAKDNAMAQIRQMMRQLGYDKVRVDFFEE